MAGARAHMCHRNCKVIAMTFKCSQFSTVLPGSLFEGRIVSLASLSIAIHSAPLLQGLPLHALWQV
eukprot:3285598-Amphidinium_carterae.1